MILVLIFAMGSALASHAMGFHPAVGTYMAGLILREEYFKGKDGKDHYKSTSQIIDNVAYSWIGPVGLRLLPVEATVTGWDLHPCMIRRCSARRVAAGLAKLIQRQLD